MHRANLLDRRAIPLTAGDIPVRTDVFLHNLPPFTLEALRRALAQGLVPTALDFAGDDNSIAILRFTRPRAGEARLFHDCCYHKCERPGTIYIGENGNPDTEWICEYHRDRWNADRDRFLADGLPCQMEQL